MTAAERISFAVPILQGLLASGHFTNPGDDSESPSVERVDNGPSWAEAEGMPARVWAARKTCLAIEVALSLVDELGTQVNLDEKNDLATGKNLDTTATAEAVCRSPKAEIPGQQGPGSDAPLHLGEQTQGLDPRLSQHEKPPVPKTQLP